MFAPSSVFDCVPIRKSWYISTWYTKFISARKQFTRLVANLCWTRGIHTCIMKASFTSESWGVMLVLG